MVIDSDVVGVFYQCPINAFNIFPTRNKEGNFPHCHGNFSIIMVISFIYEKL